MVSSNLQQVCHRVFLGRSQDLPLLRGLLEVRSARDAKLHRALEDCADRQRLLLGEGADVWDEVMGAQLRRLIELRRKEGGQA